MFKLDKQILGFIYNKCKTCGEAFGYGTFEGFITYSGIIVLGILEGIKISKHGK